MTTLTRLSILDQSPISEGSTNAEALQCTIELAQVADTYGYERYWVAEHHGSTVLACTSPEILIAVIASRTKTIRVGSGGILLPHYSPFKVAEVFSVLSSLFPARIDLGIGRTTGGGPATTHALQRDRRYSPPDDFTESVRELISLQECRLPRTLQPASVRGLFPNSAPPPELWLLGSSASSGALAGDLGLRYAFADFIAPDGAAATDAYRERIRVGAYARPQTIVAVAVVCAPSDEEASYLAQSSRVFTYLNPNDCPSRVPSPEAASVILAGAFAPTESHFTGRHTIVGSPRTVRDGIEASAAKYGADEVMIVTTMYDPRARIRSYALIAREFGLSAHKGS